MDDLSGDEIIDIFLKRGSEAVQAAKSANQKFAYYTTASTAKDILSNKEIWMRMPSCMNDFGEVQHGLDMFWRAWHGPAGAKLKSALDTVCPGTSARLVDELSQASLRRLFLDTFMACLSRHDGPDEEFGRLSMWRAYGGAAAGVALVFDFAVIGEADPALGAYSSPVEYFTDLEYAGQVSDYADRILANASRLSKLSPDYFFDLVHLSALLAILCVKHRAFEEEREWRVFSLEASLRGKLKRAVETIRGVPQPVLKLPLAGGGSSRQPLDALKQVLIGPTQYPIAVRSAFIDLLTDAQVPDPEGLVVLTGITLRQDQ